MECNATAAMDKFRDRIFGQQREGRGIVDINRGCRLTRRSVELAQFYSYENLLVMVGQIAVMVGHIHPDLDLAGEVGLDQLHRV